MTPSGRCWTTPSALPPCTRRPSGLSLIHIYCTVPHVIIEDRTEVIAHALSQAGRDDIVLIAGKGHETYQILSTGKIHYDEREVVRELLSGK